MLRRFSQIPVWLFGVTIVLVAAGTVGVMFLLENIAQRQNEAHQDVVRVVELTEETEDPAIWGKNFPSQYDSYLRTVDIERTRYGGSEAFSKLHDDPMWFKIFSGYPFGVDYREERGHAYMLSDQRETERVTMFKQPGACLHCHASVIPTYHAKGVEAGIPNDEAHRQEAIQKGFELVNTMPYSEATKLVAHPVTCGDCHNPTTMELRITRPGFLTGINVLAQSDDAVPHLPSIERWRKEGKLGSYDPNLLASRQELRSMVCAQCHVEYYFKGKEKLLTYPWQNGLKMEQIETYYDEVQHKDWEHKESGAAVLKAQHPEFELWSQGIHAASGVSCADCHMPYQREGAVKVSDHQVRSPMLNIAAACQTCHNFSEAEMQARVDTIQDRTKKLMMETEVAVVALIDDLKAAREAGRTDEELKTARDFQRKAQWRLDFIAAENSMGFHAPQEAARILAEAIDFARQGQLDLARLNAKIACPGCHNDAAQVPADPTQ
ncbi:MAG: ammonia-forming cytochrome c nitrite reductase subunit c552 [Chloroflexaceae bacterium]|jgi:nitrite reductase (cytochrome c-552)|nr:ammonia-forming cytochrome c nitrite reductase subunit c552 [Chloroflexaceae bacterium]